jgi:hypothetical protein
MLSIKFGYLRPALLALARADATLEVSIFLELLLGFGVFQTGLSAIN